MNHKKMATRYERVCVLNKGFFEETRRILLALPDEPCIMFTNRKDVLTTVCTRIEKAIKDGYKSIYVMSTLASPSIANRLRTNGIIPVHNRTAVYANEGILIAWIQWEDIHVEFLDTFNPNLSFLHDDRHQTGRCPKPFWIVDIETIHKDYWRMYIAPRLILRDPPVCVIVRNNEYTRVVLLYGQNKSKTSTLRILSQELIRELFTFIGNKC